MYTKIEAALMILKEHGKPLDVKEIIRIALKRKMIETKGKTPWLTLTGDLHNENKRRTKRGRDLRFIHLNRGVWGLVEWDLKPIDRKAKRKKEPLTVNFKITHYQNLNGFGLLESRCHPAILHKRS